MFASDWTLALFVAAVVAHVPVVYQVYSQRRRNGSEGATSERATVGDDPASEGSTVTCEDCGAENDADYRNCRACVERLPGGHRPPGPDGPPIGRVPR